jgi:hypothetical protein
MKLDHAFLFCDLGAMPEIEQLVQAGFCADFGRQHQGHGTANRLVLFEDNYLELIWIEDANLANGDPMRFPERLTLSNGHVFGVGLRVQNGQTDFLTTWKRIELNGYDGGHLRVRPDSIENLAMPIVFALVQDHGSLPTPANRGHPEALFSHPCGGTGICSVELIGPDWGSLSREGLPDEVVFRNGPSSQLRIELYIDKKISDPASETIHLGRKASFSFVQN